MHSSTKDKRTDCVYVLSTRTRQLNPKTVKCKITYNAHKAQGSIQC